MSVIKIISSGRTGVDREALDAVWWAVPSVGEMNLLRAERNPLQTSIEYLSERGGRIQFNDCGDQGHRKRLCILVDAQAGEYGDAQREKVYVIAKRY